MKKYPVYFYNKHQIYFGPNITSSLDVFVSFILNFPTLTISIDADIPLLKIFFPHDIYNCISPSYSTDALLPLKPPLLLPEQILYLLCV